MDQDQPAKFPPVLYVVFGVTLWSLGGVMFKLTSVTGFEANLGRCAFAAITIFFLTRHLGLKLDRWVLLNSLFYTGALSFFALANKKTTAANAIFLQYTAPIYIAMISPWFLGERTNWRDWLLVLLALSGVGLFFFDQLNLQGLSGVAAALGSGIAFAWLTVLMRRQRAGSPEAVVLLGNVFTFLIASPWMFPILRLEQNGVRLLLLGIVQLTIPYLLYSLAIRHVRALDAAIISIIEPILNPIWVMLATSEQPTFWSIVGGSIVLATSLTRSFLASRNA